MNFSWKTRWFGGAAVVTAGAALAVALTLGTGAAGAAGPAATTTTGSTTTAGTTTAVSKPDNTQPPTIPGTPEEGQKLVGHRGTWTGKPTDYNDFWMRCDKDGGKLRQHQRRHE